MMKGSKREVKRKIKLRRWELRVTGLAAEGARGNMRSHKVRVKFAAKFSSSAISHTEQKEEAQLHGII